MNACQRQGRMVSAKEPIPDSPHDYVWSATEPIYGCNRLVCSKCDLPVLQRTGFLASGTSARPDDARALYEADDWTAFLEDGVIYAVPTARLYVCHCATANVDDYRDIREGRPGYDDMWVPTGWRCAGHPELRLPATLDGERLARDTDWPALVRGVIRGERASDRPALFADAPTTWLLRAYHLLEHDAAAEELARAVAGALADSDFEVVAAAVDFFRLLPKAPGGEALAELTDKLSAEWRQRTTFRRRLPLGSLLQIALAERLEAAQTAGLAQVLEAGRQAVMWPLDTRARLLGVVAGYDPPWARQHAVALVEAHPTQLVLRELIRALRYSLATDELEDLLGGLWQSHAMPDSAFETVAKAELGRQWVELLARLDAGDS